MKSIKIPQNLALLPKTAQNKLVHLFGSAHLNSFKHITGFHRVILHTDVWATYDAAADEPYPAQSTTYGWNPVPQGQSALSTSGR